MDRSDRERSSTVAEDPKDPLLPLLERMARPPEATLAPGTWLGRYRVVSLLDRGGMGEVYRAHDERLGRDVAVKVLRSGERANPALQKRFETEAKAVGSLNHPNVVAVFDAGEEKGCPYLVTELLEGGTLAERLRKGTLAPAAAVEVALAIARALEAAHAIGVVHRDLKPGNVFLTADGRIKVLDFGLAKLIGDRAPQRDPVTETGAILGTVGYMSPEQVRGHPVDLRSDIFSFGTILYEMLSGSGPFEERSSPVETGYAILNDEPRPLSSRVPAALARIVERCLAKRPEDRFQSARDVVEALASTAPELLGTPPVWSELKRRRVFRALVGYGIVAFAVLQIIEPVMHGLHWPEDVLSYVVVALAVGFPIVVSLAWIFDVKSGRIERTRPVVSATAPNGPRLALLLIGIGLLAATPGTLWYLWLRPRPAAHSSEEMLRAKLEAAPAASDIGAAPSIAALPLVNLSRDPDQEYFADGLTEELLSLLARVPGLHVTGRTSSFAFKGKNEDLRTIGQKLGVATVLEGSVQKAGDRVRINVQLINAADGYHIWSESYDRKLTDVFAVQDEIAQAVVDRLRIKLLPGQTPTSKGRRAAPEVYNQYLLGKQFFNLENPDGSRRAVAAYEKALALDPGYAPAWAGLSLATLWGADPADTPEAYRKVMERSRLAADKAIQLAPALADGYAARAAFRHGHSWDWEGARADIERALALSPEDPEVLTGYGRLLVSLGRPLEGAAVERKAVERDPLNARAWRALGTALFMGEQCAEAREALSRSLEISPAVDLAAGLIGYCFLQENNPAAAAAAYQRSNSDARRRLGAALVANALGHAEESQRALDSMIAHDADWDAFEIAIVYAVRGEKDLAFQWLERAYRQHEVGFTILKVAPPLRSLRGDPRFTALLKKANLPLD